MRCKFVCSYKKAADENHGDGGSGPVGFFLNFGAVYSGSEENKRFFNKTPGGTISLHIVSPEVAAQFEVGKEYYLDFTPAPVPAPAATEEC